MLRPTRLLAALAVALLVTPVMASDTDTDGIRKVGDSGPAYTSAANFWLDVTLEASARDVERIGARPTILSRQMAIPMTAMFDAWACYDAVAVGSRFGGKLRRPESEHTQENKEIAIAYATYRTLVDQLPHHEKYITAQMKAAGYDPMNTSMDITTPVGIGNTVAKALLMYRRGDGANQYGKEIGSDGTPYSDYTMYRPVNGEEVIDPDRWQPIPFSDGKGGYFTPGFLTPHWYRVKPFALSSSDALRPGPPPLYGTDELKEQVDECIEMNANLTPEEKALVEFMRDGPRSTGQSGHWLRFAQAVSLRDRKGLDNDVKLFFTVGNTAMDAFIAAWDAKRYHDSSRPWTLVRYYYGDEDIKGWAGPGKGVVTMKGATWNPYSPFEFVTPPFPGYVSGHSCVSAACAKILELYTGSNEFGIVEERTAGALTEHGFSCDEMQQLDGRPLAELLDKKLTCDVALPMPTFSETADMAGISRVLGGYHIQADNVAGLKLGRDVAKTIWPTIQKYFTGEATVRD